MFRSLINLIRIDSGFQQEHVLTASLSLPREKYKAEGAVGNFYDRPRQRAGFRARSAKCGSRKRCSVDRLRRKLGGFNIEGKQPPPHQEFRARYHFATPDYFRALGIPLLRGRFFTEADKPDAPNVMIINQAMAELYWPHEDAVGKRLNFVDTPTDKDWITVVGIVGNVKDQPKSPGTAPAFWWANAAA